MPSGNSARTVAAWFFSYGNQNGSIVTLGNTNGNNARFSLLVSGDTLRVVGQGNDHFNVPFNHNTWTHVAATHDGTTLRLYVDGTEQDSTSFTSNLDSARPLVVGARDDNSGNEHFQGLIDNVSVWSVARSAFEVVEELEGNSLSGLGGLVAWYTFAEGSGSTATDYSGVGNHGTIYGANYSASSVCDE